MVCTFEGFTEYTPQSPQNFADLIFLVCLESANEIRAVGWFIERKDKHSLPNSLLEYIN